MKITIGADPELFVRSKGKFISGYNMIKGTKAKPFPVHDGAVQVDGMALEFNINPANSKGEFVHHISSVLSTLKGMIPKEYELVAEPVAMFTKEYMDKQPKAAKQLGCDPDFNAYTQLQNEMPKKNLNMRTASGHVHIGWTDVKDKFDPRHFNNCIALVKQLDCFLGMPSVLLEEKNRRREMYGKAGAFRPKQYGCEYRVLSNFWLKDEQLMGWVYDNTMLAIEQLKSERPVYRSLNASFIINSGNKDAASYYCRKHNIPVLS